MELMDIPTKPAALFQAADHRVGQVIDRVRLIRQGKLLLAHVQLFQRVTKMEQVRLPLAHGWPSFPASDSFVDGWMLSKHYAKGWLFPRGIAGSSTTACQ